MYEEKQLSDEDVIEDSSSCVQRSPRYKQPRMDHIWSSRSKPLPELAGYSSDDSDLDSFDSDDSSKYLNRLFVQEHRPLIVNDFNSQTEIDDSEKITVTLSRYNTRAFEKNSDPMNQLIVARSRFEERLKQRESDRLRTPESLRVLEILVGSILSPVATLLIKLHAPNDWNSCESCDGFIEPHCCLKSQWREEFEHPGGAVVLNFRQ